jgi:large subunit ribosomal protein L16
MLQPKRAKFRKTHKGRRRGNAQVGNQVSFGDYGLKATSTAWVTARQIEAARRAITRHFRRGGQVWIRVFPDKPVTTKPAETRMGGGKGSVDYWVAVVKPGRVIFEVSGIEQGLAREALRLASQKLPISTIMISRGETQQASE